MAPGIPRTPAFELRSGALDLDFQLVLKLGETEPHRVVRGAGCHECRSKLLEAVKAGLIAASGSHRAADACVGEIGAALSDSSAHGFFATEAAHDENP